MARRRRWAAGAACGLALTLGPWGHGEEATPLAELPDYAVRVANPVPAGTFATAVTGLRYEPLVDVQARGLAEGQADVTVRGGNFDNTGFTLGVLPVHDPQTGHYFAELPLDPAMLGAPRLLTGPEHAMRTAQSTSGAIGYEFAPAQAGGRLSAGVGEHGLQFQEAAATVDLPGRPPGGQEWSAEVSVARSEGDGTVAAGDHRFHRYAGRLQARGSSGQTDLVAGYLDKFHGWPGAYTGNPSFPETDAYRLTFAALHHRQDYDEGGTWSAGVSYRELVDDYELDRRQPGYFRRYEHRTELWTAALAGRHPWAGWTAHYGASVQADRLESTDLVYGPYQSRAAGKFHLAAGRSLEGPGGGEWALLAGLTQDVSDRHRDTLSPLASLEWRRTARGHSDRIFLTYARSSQLPGYTALASPPPPGAFAGNPRLDRQTSNSGEIGWARESATGRVQAVWFVRQDHNLADWTYDSTAPRTLRQAQAVDLETRGVEVVGQCGGPTWRATLGYTWLEKSPDYAEARVDASFYALNFARHRATAALLWRPLGWVETRLDLEARAQEPNAKRVGGDTAWRLSAGVTVAPPAWRGLSLGLVADNLTDDDFQDLPGTPAEGRQVTALATYRW